jgi:transcriptional regulator with AAA-type ATPase domain
LFLDEIGDMSLELQTRLLRVLETGTILRVGGSDLVPVDVRVIAATNREPIRAVEEGRCGRISTIASRSSRSSFRRCVTRRGHRSDWPTTSSPQ